jgi:NADPH:quinone reductase-like Zn-dependent oxidoreductase
MHCSHLLVTGASGGVGSSAVLLAKAVGCRFSRHNEFTRLSYKHCFTLDSSLFLFLSHHFGRVTAVTSNADKAAFVKKLGADSVVVANDLANFHKLLPPGGKADIAIDCVGGPTMNASLRSVKSGGSIVVLGNVENRFEEALMNAHQCWPDTARSVFPLPLGYIILNSIRIFGSDSVEREQLTRLFAFMDSHSLRPRLHSVLPLKVQFLEPKTPCNYDARACRLAHMSVLLQEAARAHEIVESRGVQGRVVLDVDAACWD